MKLAFEDEAKRRCLAAGYALDFECRRLTSFELSDRRLLWRAHFLKVARREHFGALAIVFSLALSPALVVLGAVIWNGGWR